ncbi:gastrula zinc finger protein XlCGF66.1-like [Discoglossus pictus]
MMDESMNNKKVTEVILKHALEIVFLLTGEQYVVVKIKAEIPPYNTNSSISEAVHGVPVPPNGSMADKKHRDNMILRHASNIIILLSGEIPVRYDNVAMYFTTDELQYCEEHKEIYKDIMESYQTASPQGKYQSYIL